MEHRRFRPLALALIATFAGCKGEEPSVPADTAAEASKPKPHPAFTPDLRVEKAYDALRKAPDSRRTSNESREALLNEAREAVEAWASKYEPLLGESKKCFINPDERAVELYDDAKRLNEAGIRASPRDLLQGAVFLVKSSKHPGRFDHRFGEFVLLYEMWRKEGLGHADAVMKIYELEKF